jgi:outer membrane protein OmpA-like peptidoglycan-associated protein
MRHLAFFSVLSFAFITACGATPRRSVLARLEGDHILIERNVYFQPDSATIVDGSNDLLDAIARVCEEHPEIARVHVVGHTDTNGDDEHNRDLSDRRANAVVRALRQRGVSQELDARGAGETERVCFTEDDACHQRNRRVEFIVELTATPAAD